MDDNFEGRWSESRASTVTPTSPETKLRNTGVAGQTDEDIRNSDYKETGTKRRHRHGRQLCN